MRRYFFPLLLSVIPATHADWGIYPGDIFHPVPDQTDSVSVRQTQHSAMFQASGNPRTDVISSPNDGAGHPLWTKILHPPQSTVDSVFQSLDWSQTVPSPDPRQHGPAPYRIIETTFLHSVLQSTDTSWYAWDATRHTLVTTATDQDSGCSGRDSTFFDAQGRVTTQTTCELVLDQGSDQPYLNFLIYRAWFANTTDSLPARESAWERAPSGDSPDDSVAVVGTPNRPDSLIWQGSLAESMKRDQSGRLIRTTTYLLGTNQAYDSNSYAYDSKGRLSSMAYLTFGDTVTFLYAWNDAAGIRRASIPARNMRLVGNDLVVDLPTPDRVSVDLITLDGKSLPIITNRMLPAGRTLLPFPSRPGQLVRARSSQGEAVLKVPLR